MAQESPPGAAQQAPQRAPRRPQWDDPRGPWVGPRWPRRTPTTAHEATKQAEAIRLPRFSRFSP
eukprot:406917-Pyramimonas_sp.AAC.1